jgi:tetratricopeptide (TPR) repeat protein
MIQHPNRQRVVIALLLGIFMLPVAALMSQTLEEKIKSAGKLQQEGKMAEARDILLKLIKENPLAEKKYKLDMWFRLGFIQTDLKEYAPSIVSWQEFIKLEPKYPVAWGNLGWSFYLIGQKDSAVIATLRALKLDSTIDYCLANMGLYKLDEGKVDEAMVYYEKTGKHLSQKTSIQGPFTDLDELEKQKPDLAGTIKTIRELLTDAAKRKFPDTGKETK